MGSWSLLAYVLCAGLIALFIFCFAELASRFKHTGGPYLYARQAFGPAVGFQVGWLLWLARVTSFASLCNALVDYCAFFWPQVRGGNLRAGVILGVVVALTALNIIGVRRSTTAINLFTIGKLTALIGFIAVGVFFIQPANFSFDVAPSTGSMLAAITAMEAAVPKNKVVKMMPLTSCTFESSSLMRRVLVLIHIRRVTMNQMNAIPENGMIYSPTRRARRLLSLA